MEESAKNIDEAKKQEEEKHEQAKSPVRRQRSKSLDSEYESISPKRGRRSRSPLPGRAGNSRRRNRTEEDSSRSLSPVRKVLGQMDLYRLRREDPDKKEKSKFVEISH